MLRARRRLAPGRIAFLLWLGIGVGCGADPSPDGVDAESLEQLRGLGYLDWTEGEGGDERGVVLHDPARAQPGWNLYCARSEHLARLVDMEGRVRHEWRVERAPGSKWHHVELTPEGDLIAVVRERALMRIAWDSRVRWVRRMPVHHDVALGRDGRIYALSSRLLDVAYRGGSIPVADDTIAVLSEDGAPLREISLWKLLGGRVPERRLEQIHAARPGAFESWWLRLRGKVRLTKPSDVFHANSIELLPRDVPGLGRRGDALVSVRNLDQLVVIDLERERIVWSLGEGVLERQHDARLIAGGGLLVFDNGPERGWSRVVELEPATGAIRWEYRGDPPDSFFTKRMGGSQQLPNGNVLATLSHQGRALELTRAGEPVWEFLTPEAHGEGGKRATVYRVTRVPPEVVAQLPSEPRASGVP